MALVCFGFGFAPRAAHAQSSATEATAVLAEPLAAPPAPPPGVTPPPQASEQTPVPRLPPAFPASGYERSPERPTWRPFAGRPWYGNEILISDAVTVSLTGLGMGLAANHGNNGEVLLLGFGSYVLASPIIHGVHERWGIATASLSMRFFVPLAGALIGANSGTCPRNDEGDDLFCGSSAAIEAGFLGGMALASAIDASLFSYENRKPEAYAASTFGIAPALSPDGKRGELRAFGTF